MMKVRFGFWSAMAVLLLSGCSGSGTETVKAEPVVLPLIGEATEGLVGVDVSDYQDADAWLKEHGATDLYKNILEQEGIVVWVKAEDEKIVNRLRWVRIVSADSTGFRLLEIPSAYVEKEGEIGYDRISKVEVGRTFGIAIAGGLPPSFQDGILEFRSGRDDGNEVLGTIRLEGLPVTEENSDLSEAEIVTEAKFTGGETVTAARVDYLMDDASEEWEQSFMNIQSYVSSLDEDRLYRLRQIIVESTWQPASDPNLWTSSTNGPSITVALMNSPHDQARKMRLRIQLQSMPRSELVKYEISGIKVLKEKGESSHTLDFKSAKLRQVSGPIGKITLGLPMENKVALYGKPFRFEVSGSSGASSTDLWKSVMVSAGPDQGGVQVGRSDEGVYVQIINDDIKEISLIVENSLAMDRDETVELVIPTSLEDIQEAKRSRGKEIEVLSGF